MNFRKPTKSERVGIIIGICLFTSVAISGIYNTYFVPKDYKISFSGVFEREYQQKRPHFVIRINKDSIYYLGRSIKRV